MTTTTRRPPGSTPPPRARPGRRRRPRPAEDAAAPAKPPAEPKPATKPAAKSATKPAARPAAKPATKSAPKSSPSRKAAPARRAAPPRAPFVLLICGLMSGALVSLLLLNTVLAEDAFTLTRLQENNKLLEQRREALREEIAREESPERLARKAESLGMQKPQKLAIIDGVTGKVIGGSVRPVPHSAAAAAGAAGVIGIPGAIVPGDGIPSAPGAADGRQRTGGAGGGGRNP